MMDVMAAFIGKTESDTVIAPFWNWVSTELPQFWLCILGYEYGDWLQTTINKVLADISIPSKYSTLPAADLEWVSTKPQPFSVLHLWYSMHSFMAIIHISCNGGYFNLNSTQYLRYPILQMRVNRVSTIFGLVYWVIKALHRYKIS
jgi:hypothetical protein